MPRLLTDIKINEVSAVDRGAGERVRVLLMKRQDDDYGKREFSDDKRKELAANGHALPDGSFPIENKGDLKNAIQAIGRAKNPAKAKAHIKARAKALGATDMLPEDWGKRDAEETDMTIDKKHEDFLAALLAKHDAKIAKKAKRAEIEKAMLPSEATFYKTLTEKADLKAFREMTAEQRAAVVKAGKFPPKKPAANDDDEDDKTSKSLAKRIEDTTNDVLAKALNANRELEQRIAKMEGEKQLDLAKRDAKELGLQESDGEVLMKARNGDREAVGKMEKLMKQLKDQRDEAARTGGIFKELGGAGDSVKKSALDELNALAVTLRKSEPKLTEAQAFDKVLTDPANRELAARERDERMQKIQKAA